jgi:hypothetical protein
MMANDTIRLDSRAHDTNNPHDCHTQINLHKYNRSSPSNIKTYIDIPQSIFENQYKF